MAFIATPYFRDCVARALTLAIGKPWKVGARGPLAFDCWGLITWAYSAGGIALPDWLYSINDRPATLFEEGIKESASIDFQRARDKAPFSIVTLAIKGSVTHVAIYANDVYYHTLLGLGVVGQSESVLHQRFQTFAYWYPQCK